MDFGAKWNKFSLEWHSLPTFPCRFAIGFMDSGHIVEEAPALHGLTPELMFQACFVQACTGAFQYVPILALYDTISGRSVVRAGVVPPFEAGRCLLELSCVVGVEEFWVAAAGEVAQGHSCRVGVFRRNGLGVKPHCNTIVATYDEPLGVVTHIPLVELHMACGYDISKGDWFFRAHPVFTSRLATSGFHLF